MPSWLAIVSWSSILLLSLLIALASRCVHRRTKALRCLPGVGLLGLPRSTPSTWMARVAHPLLLPVETIHEEPAEPHLPLEQLQGEESPRPPLVRGRWQYRSVLDEGVWEEGVHMRVLTLPAAPFRIIEASPGWLGFCGFRWGEVKGCTLRIVQGEKTEFHQVRHMLDRAAAGEAAQVVVTNYTKNGIEFSNHVLVSPIFDLNGLLRCFDVCCLARLGARVASVQTEPNKTSERNCTPASS